MPKKSALIISCIGLVSIFGVVAFANLPNNIYSDIDALSGNYDLSIRKLTNEEISAGEATVYTKSGNPIKFAFDSGKSSLSNDGVISLSPGGYFKNDTIINGIKSISGALSSTATLAYGNNDLLNYGSADLDGTFSVNLDYPSNYFSISTDVGTVIESLSITYSCISSPDKVDNDHIISYTFNGDETSIKGYAQGQVTLTNNKGLTKGDTYSFYWGDELGRFTNFYPLYSETLSTAKKTISFEIEENVSIPKGIKTLTVYKGDEYLTSYLLPESKVFDDDIIYRYASISDVHCNYNQGEKHLLELLNRFEEEQVKYIILSGDIGETQEQFDRYMTACLSSNYTGLILSCPGNHDQKTQTALDIYRSVAMYDGRAHKFISIPDGPNYFATQYSGSLPIEVFYEDVEGSNNTYYYYATIADNMYYFMDMMQLNADGYNRFSKKQLDHLESILSKYSSNDEDLKYDEYNLFIIEHAPLDQFKVGDKFKPGYGGQAKVAPYLDNNYRLAKILEEYHEAFFINGHTHVQFEQLEEQYKVINFTDRYYDLSGELTNKPFARVIHNSSVAMPRWFYIKNGGLTMSSQNDHSSGSEAYIVNQYGDRTVFNAISNKEYTPEQTAYDPNLYELKYFSKYSYACPKLAFKHSPVVDYAALSYMHREGSSSINKDNDKINLTLTSGDTVRFDLGNQDIAYDQGESIKLVLSSEVKTFTLSGASKDGTISKSVDIDLSKSNNKYSYGLRDNKYTLQVDIKDLFSSKVDGYNVVLSNFNGNMDLFSFRVMKHDDVTARGEHTFTTNIDLSYEFEEDVYSAIQFDYRVESGTTFEMCIMSKDWQSYYGYWKFNTNGTVNSETGVTTQKLDDGYVRVNVDFSISKYNKKVDTLARFYVRGDHTTACGYVDNIILTKGEVVPPPPSDDRGDSFSSNKDFNKTLTPINNLTHVTFEYRIDSGDHFNVSIFNNNDWEAYYGYYEFNKNGCTSSNKNGITTEKLADGYIKVTMEYSKLDKTQGKNGAPSKPINYFYIRGNWSDANGYIDNITLESR